MKDYYHILEIGKDATEEQIKKQYRFLAQAWHPDQFASLESKTEAESKLKQIREAYNVLTDPTKREAYDQEREPDERQYQQQGIIAGAEKKPLPWKIDINQMGYGVVGAILYGLLSWLLSKLYFLSLGGITFHPEIALLIFIGIVYGPWAGLLAGFLGKALADGLSDWGFYWNWIVGYGIMGMIPGMVKLMGGRVRSLVDMGKAIGWGTLGIFVGILFASLSDVLLDEISLNTAIFQNFKFAFIENFVMMVLFLPILLIVFAKITTRRG